MTTAIIDIPKTMEPVVDHVLAWDRVLPEGQTIEVAITGPAGSLKSSMGEALATALMEIIGPGCVIDVDNWLVDQAARGIAPPDFCWPGYDWTKYRQEAIQPALAGEAFSYRTVDWRTGRPGPEVHVPPTRWRAWTGVGLAAIPEIMSEFPVKALLRCDPRVAIDRGKTRDRAELARDRQTGDPIHFDDEWETIWGPNDLEFAQHHGLPFGSQEGSSMVAARFDHVLWTSAELTAQELRK